MAISGAAANQTTTTDPGNNRDGVGDIATISPSELQDLLPGATQGMDDRGNTADNPAADIFNALAGVTPKNQQTQTTQTETAPTQTPTPQPITTQKSQTDQTVQTDKDASPSSQPAVDPSGQQPEQPVISDEMKFTVRGDDGQEREITGKEMREILAASKTVENAGMGAGMNAESINASITEIAGELHSPQYLQEVNRCASELTKTTETLNNSKEQRAHWREQARIAQRDADAENLYAAQKKVEEWDDYIAYVERTQRDQESAYQAAQSGFNNSLNEVSTRVVSKQFPEIGKLGLTGIATEVQKTFGIPSHIIQDYLRDGRVALAFSAGLTHMRTLGKGAQALTKAEQVPAAFILNTGASSADASTKIPARKGADPQRGAQMVQYSKQLFDQGDPMSALMGLANAMGHFPEIERAMGFDGVIPSDVNW